jgi:hypothetical protein
MSHLECAFGNRLRLEAKSNLESTLYKQVVLLKMVQKFGIWRGG